MKWLRTPRIEVESMGCCLIGTVLVLYLLSEEASFIDSSLSANNSSVDNSRIPYPGLG